MMNSQYLDKYVVTQMVIGLVILLLTPLMSVHSLILQIIGSVFFIIGFLILIIAAKQLGAALTPVVTPKQNTQLVTSGIYGIVRHPIYAGVIAMAIGWSVFWGALLSFITSLILIIFFDFKAKKEEILLSKKYSEYEQYKSKVKKKIIPFIY